MEELRRMQARYNAFVRAHATQVTAVENALRSASFFIPGRYGDAEVVSEAVYATVNLAAIYHDAVIAQDGQRTFFEAATPTGKYRSYLATSTAYTTAAYALAVIQAAELILEMLAKKRLSDSARWRVVLALEFAKTLCRLRLLQLSGGRMVAQNPLPDSTRSSTDIGALTSALGLPNPAKLAGAPAVAKPDAAAVGGGDDAGSSQITDGQRAGRTRPSLATVKRASGKAGVAGAAEFVGAQAPIFDQGPLAVHAKLDQVHMLAELLYTLRPLLYVLAIVRFGPRSWRAWLIGIVIELASRILARRATAPAASSLTEADTAENKRRDWLLAYNALRAPLFQEWTKPLLTEVSETLQRVPLISLAAGGLKDYMRMWEEYYFYTAASS